MELIHSSTTQTVQRTVNVVGGPVIEVQILGKPREVRVSQLRVSYSLQGEWRAYDVHLTGVVRHNGRDTKGTHDYALGKDWEHAARWELVRNIVDSLRPIGAAHLPFASTVEHAKEQQ